MSSGQVRDALGEPVTLVRLQALTPKLGATIRAKLLDHLRQLRGEGQLVDSTSFICNALGTTPLEGSGEIHLTNHTNGAVLQQVEHEGEIFRPYRLLPDGTEMEMRELDWYTYDTIPAGHVAEVAAAVKERADSIAHCEKLLRDLPVALANSKAALQAHVTEVDVELSDLGAMVLEQARIRQEVAAQTTKLAELEATPVPQPDEERLTSRWVQKMVHLRFGLNRLGSQLIQVTQIHSVATNLTLGLDV